MDFSILNDRQKESVLHTEGPLCVLAGAGAGKTLTLAMRIAHLMEKGVFPSSILAITFTNKAAKEMVERIEKVIFKSSSLSNSSYGERPFVRTFHSLGVHILRENSHLLNLKKQFTILDRDDSLKVLKRAFVQTNINSKEYDLPAILGKISRKKGDMFKPDDLEKENLGYLKEILPPVWRKYEEILKTEGTLDFDDLLIKTVELLKSRQEILKKYQDRWPYLHIDEYQDTNQVQYMLARMLAERSRNICVVGDIDQNIYSWRGATIKNILEFEQDYPEAKTVLLEQNYRSTKNILQAANSVIKKNQRRKEKNLFTQNEDGEKVLVFNSLDEKNEADFVAKKSKEMIQKGILPNEIAVLYRANFQSRVLEEAFLKNNVPYKVVGTRFFERKEIKDIVAYLRASINPTDLTSLERIINFPPRGIGKITFLKICEGRENEIRGAGQENIFQFRRTLEQIREQVGKISPRELVTFIIEKSGIGAHLKKGDADDHERLQNVQELASLAKKYDSFEPEEGLNKFLEEIALSSDQDEIEKNNEGGVRLMTVHASKGLEFKIVFVVGLEQGLFPQEKWGEDLDDDEEERRLFYVAITRAQKQLFLCHASIRTLYGSLKASEPSEFLKDIDPEILENQCEYWDENKQSGKKEYLVIDF